VSLSSGRSDAAGIGKRLIADLSNHWQVRVTAESEIGFNAAKQKRERSGQLGCDLLCCHFLPK
jgi:hypothetical protein